MPPPKPYREWNDLAAYQFDNAVLFAGLTIENASQEREECGPDNARQSRPKYTLAQLLDPDFRLPTVGGSNTAPHPEGSRTPGVKSIIAANPGIVGQWREARPGELTL